MIEGGAQRLIQGRHGARLAVNEGAKFNSYGAVAYINPIRRCARCTEPLRIAQRNNGALRLTPARIIWRCSGFWC